MRMSTVSPTVPPGAITIISESFGNRTILPG
jgi:hypothetical protein